ncbi:MAG: single-stranded DNA-binding protein [Magnetococcus sp. YQC-9]
MTENHQPTQALNHVEFDGRLMTPVDYRVTPAGRPVAYLEVEHFSTHDAPETALRLEARVVVVTMGALAESCRGLTSGTRLRVIGRLNQKRWVRDGQVRWGRLELLALKIEILASDERHSLE